MHDLARIHVVTQQNLTDPPELTRYCPTPAGRVGADDPLASGDMESLPVEFAPTAVDRRRGARYATGRDSRDNFADDWGCDEWSSSDAVERGSGQSRSGCPPPRPARHPQRLADVVVFDHYSAHRGLTEEEDVVSRALKAVVVASGLTLVGALSAGALVAGPRAVTGPSPFIEGCENPVTTPSAAGAEVEPFVATDPSDSRHLIGVWQQDRFSDGGARGLGTAVSSDGGRNWMPATPPAFSHCTGGTAVNGGDYERATDPWVSIGLDRNGGSVAYQISDSFNNTDAVNAILVSRSLNGGSAWEPPITLIRDSGGRDVSFAFNDKESVTADPKRPCYAYAVWDRLVGPAGSSKASAAAYEHAAGYRGPTWFSRTSDCGVSWSTARQIYDPGQLNQTIGNQIAVLADGTLLNIFDQIDSRKNAQGVRGENIALQRSTDQGLTWSSPVIVAKAQSVGVTAADGIALRTGDNIPDIAIGPNKRVYAVWQDGRFSGGAHDDIAIAQSSDGGLTWSAPQRVSGGGFPAFNPAVEVTPNGRLGVGYHELTGSGVSRLLVASLDGSLMGLTSPDVVGSAGPITNAPVARGYFLGDYQGLTASGENLVSFFVNPNTSGSPNQTDVYAAVS